MRLEWVFFGVVLLSVGLCLKILLDKQLLPRMTLGFSIVWALTAAMHFWVPACSALGGPIDEFLPALVPVELLCFWLVAILALIPGVILTKVVVRDIYVSVPVVVDRMLNLAMPCAATVALSTSVIMSGTLLGGSLAGLVPAHEGVRNAYEVVQSLPVTVYVSVAAVVSGQDSESLLAKCVPKRAQKALFEGAR